MMRNSWRMILAYVATGALAILTPGCSDDDDGELIISGAEELYLAHTVTFTADNPTSLINPLTSLDTANTLEPSEALEFPGFVGLIASPLIENVFFVAAAEAPEIIRFRLSQDDGVRIEEAGRLSFGNLQSIPTAVARPAHIESPTRAFFVLQDARLLMVWNPQEMTILQTISLEGLFDEEGLTAFATDILAADGRLFVAAQYRRTETTLAPLTRVAIVDPATLMVQYTEDRRCGYNVRLFDDDGGNVYAISHPSQDARVAAGVDGDSGFPHCIIRIASGEDAFQRDFFIDIQSVAGGAVTGGFAPALDGRVFISVSPRAPEEFNPENVDALSAAEEWEIYSFLLDSPESSFEPVEGAPVTTMTFVGDRFSGFGDQARARALVGISSADFATSTLFDASSPNDWRQGASAAGFTYNLVRIR